MTKTPSLGICGVIVLAAGVVTLAAPAQRYAPAVDRMTGTYQLDSSRGDTPQRAAEQATRSLPPDRRDRVYESLINRLSPPAQLALDRKGRTVTIVSSTARARRSTRTAGCATNSCPTAVKSPRAPNWLAIASGVDERQPRQ